MAASWTRGPWRVACLVGPLRVGEWLSRSGVGATWCRATSKLGWPSEGDCACDNAGIHFPCFSASLVCSLLTRVLVCMFLHVPRVCRLAFVLFLALPSVAPSFLGTTSPPSPAPCRIPLPPGG